MQMTNYGNSVVINLSFTTKEGVPSDKIKPGTWVIIFGEIPARKLSNGMFACYPECGEIQVKTLEEKLDRQLKLLNNAYIDIKDELFENKQRYVFRKGKMKKKNFLGNVVIFFMKTAGQPAVFCYNKYFYFFLSYIKHIT